MKRLSHWSRNVNSVSDWLGEICRPMKELFMDVRYRRLDVDIAMEGVMFTENLIRRAAVKVETFTFSTSLFTLFF